MKLIERMLLANKRIVDGSKDSTECALALMSKDMEALISFVIEMLDEADFSICGETDEKEVCEAILYRIDLWASGKLENINILRKKLGNYPISKKQAVTFKE